VPCSNTHRHTRTHTETNTRTHTGNPVREEFSDFMVFLSPFHFLQNGMMDDGCILNRCQNRRQYNSKHPGRCLGIWLRPPMYVNTSHSVRQYVTQCTSIRQYVTPMYVNTSRKVRQYVTQCTSIRHTMFVYTISTNSIP